MSLNLIETLSYDSITSLVRKAGYGLLTTFILGTAAYAGYRVAVPEKYSIKRYRHPELNDQVSYIKQTSIVLISYIYFQSDRKSP